MDYGKKKAYSCPQDVLGGVAMLRRSNPELVYVVPTKLKPCAFFAPSCRLVMSIEDRCGNRSYARQIFHPITYSCPEQIAS
jgi:hypothetical protein